MKYKFTFMLVVINAFIFMTYMEFDYDVNYATDLGAIHTGFINGYYKFLTHIFLHFSINHYLGNLFNFIIISLLLENSVDDITYLTSLILISLFGGIIIYYINDTNKVVAGLSGIIHGFTVLLFVLSIKNIIKLNRIAKIYIIGMVLYLIVLNILRYGEISLEGHIGGVLGGLYMCKLYIDVNYIKLKFGGRIK